MNNLRSLTRTTCTALKLAAQPIVIVTGYDAPSAKICDAAEVDIILVGDSVGAAVLGYDGVEAVTLADMVHHTAAVARGANRCAILADMPIHSFITPKETVSNAQLLMAAGAHGVKIEGGREIAAQLAALVKNNIPVCGHIGYTPQTPGIKASVVGKEIDEALCLIDEAKFLDKIGVSMVVLELIPEEVAAIITRQISVPTIGIGAGKGCSGQVQVWHDILGFSAKKFRHTHIFGDALALEKSAVLAYAQSVHAGTFPEHNNAAHVSLEFCNDLLKKIEPHAPTPKSQT